MRHIKACRPESRYAHPRHVLNILLRLSSIVRPFSFHRSIEEIRLFLRCNSTQLASRYFLFQSTGGKKEYRGNFELSYQGTAFHSAKQPRRRYALQWRTLLLQLRRAATKISFSSASMVLAVIRLESIRIHLLREHCAIQFKTLQGKSFDSVATRFDERPQMLAGNRLRPNV